MGKILLGLGFLLVSTVLAIGQPSSTFDTDTEGWTAPISGSGIKYNVSGGNPGGFVYAQDAPNDPTTGAPVIWYFRAPAEFLGNQSAYYNGTLFFDLSAVAGVSSYTQRADIILTAGGVSLYYFNLSPTFAATYPSWTRYGIALNELSGKWKTANASTATAATQAQIISVLSGLTSVSIRGRFNSETLVITALDNVSYQPFAITTQPQASVTACIPNNVSLKTVAVGNSDLSYQWQKFNGTIGGWLNVPVGAGYSGSTSPVLDINTSTTGTGASGSYRCVVSQAGSASLVSNTSAVTVGVVPSNPTVTPNSRCGPGTVTLTASGGTAGQYRWYTSAGTLIAGITAATYSPSLTATTSFFVSINNGVCESALVSVTATVNPVPPTPVTTDGYSCGPGVATLKASGGVNGQYRWYTATGLLIGGQTSDTYSPNITATSTYTVYINDGTCQSTGAAVTATLRTIPATPTGSGGSTCGPGTVTLTAVGASAGQYRWYDQTNTLIAGQTNATYSPTVTTTTNFSVAINDGFCEGGKKLLTATVLTPPAAPGVTNGSSCGPGTVTLTATGAGTLPYRWYTSALVLITGVSGGTYSPSVTTTTNYFVSIFDGTCESTKVGISAIVNPVPLAPGTTSNSSCGPGVVTLTATGAGTGTYRWYTSAGLLIAGQTTGTYSPNVTITTSYLVSIFDGTCEGPKASVTATVNPVPLAPGTTGGSSCGPATITLTATGAGTGTYRWYTSAGVLIAGQTTATYSPSVTTTTSYLVSIYNGLCEGPKASVTATVNPLPLAPGTTGGSSCGPATITLTATGAGTGTYRWYTSAGVIIAGQTTATYSPNVTATTSYLVSIFDGTCEGPKASVTATVNPVPLAPGTTGGSSCGPGVVTLTAAGAGTGTYRWYTSAGVIIAGQTTATYSPNVTATTSYLVSIFDGTCEGAKASVTATVNPVPLAPGTTGGSSCGPATITLTATGAGTGTYRWYTSAGVIIAGQTTATYSPSVTTTTSYLVSIFNGTCEGPKASVTATVNPVPLAPGTTGGSSCGPGVVTLTAAGAGTGTYRWYTSAGVIIAGQTTATYSPNVTATTSYLVSIFDGTCEGPKASVTATINPVPLAPGTTGGSSCGPGVVTLTASGAGTGTYRWYTSAGVIIAGQTTATYSPNVTATTSYLVSIFDGTCEGPKASVTATVNPVPLTPGTTGGSSCGPATITLTATGAGTGTYRWYTSAGVIIAGQTTATYSPNVTATTSYLVSIFDGTCEGAKASVTATVNPVPLAPGTTGGSSCGPGVITLTAAGAGTGTYRWYTSAGVIIAGQTTATYSPNVTATTSYLVSIFDGTCEGPKASVTATVNPVPLAPGTTGGSSCGPATITLTATGAGTGTYRWYTSAGVIIAGQTTATYSPNVTATTSYLVSIFDGTCEGPKASVTATVNPVPLTPGTTGGSSCGPATITLTATGAGTGTYRWYTNAGVIIAGQTTATYSPNVTATTNYLVSIFDGTCEGPKASVTATVNPVPLAPGTTGGSSCGPGVITLTASGAGTGTYRWYTSAGVIIAGQTTATYSPNVTATTSYLVSIFNGTCEGSKTSVTATVNPVPLAPGTSGGSSCGPGVITLTATGAVAGDYRWYTNAGVPISGQTGATYSPSVTTTTTFRVAINNGLCEGPQTSVTATVNTVPSAPVASGGSSCGPGIVTLSATGGSAGEYRWYTNAGVLITGQTSASYSPSVTATTTFKVAINNGFCEGPQTSVTATVNPIPLAPGATGNSSCGPATITLNATGAGTGTYRWYTSAGVLISGQTASSYSPSVTTTTSFLVSIYNGFCEGPQTSVTATVNTIPSAPGTTGNSSCGPGVITLTASGASAGQYRWYTSAGVLISGQTGSSYSPSVTTTTTFLVAIDNGFCEGPQTSVIATVNTVPSSPGATGGSSCGPGTITLNATGAVAGQYRWYTNAGVLIAGQTGSSYAPSVTTTTSYLVSINDGTCEGAKTSVTATVNPVPLAPGATGGSSCGPGTITLTASGAGTGTYRWYTSTNTLISGQTASTYSPTVTATTNYFVSIFNGTCEGPKTSVTATVNTIPPTPTTSGGFSCIPAVITLGASGGTNGQYRWYTSAVGGSPITGQTSDTFITILLSITTVYYVSIDNGVCESPRASVTATINLTPSGPTASGGASCGSGSVTLTASGGSAGQYRWYTAANVLIAGQTNSTYTVSITATTNFYVSLYNGVCESPQTLVTATFNTPPSAPGATGGSSCGPSTITLNATGAGTGSYRWYTNAGVLIAGQTAASYSPSVTTTTSYLVSIFNGTCEGPKTSVTATVNVEPAAPGATGNSSCGPGTVTLNATGAGTGSYRWYTNAGVLISGQTGSSYAPTVTTTTNFFVSIFNGTCEGPQTSVVATVNPLPVTPGVTGGSSCGPGTITLTASNGSAGQYRWYTNAGVLISGQTASAYSPSVTTTTSYFVSINNGTCEGPQASITATVNTIPSAPGATGNSSCGPGSIALNATGASAGQYRWYTSGNILIAGQTGSTYTPTVTTTTSYFVSIFNGSCEGSKTPVTATVNTLPSAPGASGNSSCGPATITLSATGASAGQYRWYTNTGVLISGQTASTYSPSVSTTTNYFVSINNGICEGPQTSVTATVNTIPSAPSATGGSSCVPTTITLNASGASAGQYRWYTSANVLIAGQTGASYSPLVTSTTSFFVSINNGLCEGPKTSVTATINSTPPTPTSGGGSLCGPGTVTLTAAGGSDGEYRWYTTPVGGTAISGAFNSIYVTTSLSTTTNYYVSLNFGACEGARALSVATINGLPAAPSTTGNSACGPSSITLSASGGTNGQYRWYNSSNVLIAGETNSSYVTSVISTNTDYFVSINNGICESSKTIVTAVINSLPPAPSVTGNSVCGSSSVALNATGGTNGQYRWYTSGGTLISGQTSSAFITPLLTATTSYLVSINNGNCESAQVSVTATILTPPSAPVVNGASSCGAGFVTLTASGGTAGQYRWYTSAGVVINGETNSTYAPSITATTSYLVSINNGTCESSKVAITATVNSIPSAPTASGNTACGPAIVTLTANGAANGQYRWYTAVTGGTAIAGQVNSVFATPSLTSTTTYFVAINNGTCESTRTPVVATITTCTVNLPPTISTETAKASIGGEVTINLLTHISDPDNNLDLSTLKVITAPVSGAKATIDSKSVLHLDYSGLTFSGEDKVVIGICDLLGSCVQQEFAIDVSGGFHVYTGLSPNGDGKNDIWILESVDLIVETKQNHVTIFNRWGDVVFEVDNYDNVNHVFNGISKNGSELPSGTYFFKIEFASGKKTETGYLSLKR